MFGGGAPGLIRATALARHPAGVFDDGSELWARAAVHPRRLNFKQPGAKDSRPGGALQAWGTPAAPLAG